MQFFRVQIHANCRIRRIYFSDRLYTEDELPPEFKLFLPVAGKTQQWARPAVKLARPLLDCRDYYLLLSTHTILSQSPNIFLSYFTNFVLFS